MYKITKQDLIYHLKNHVFCRIGVSQIDKGGVGVIAVKDIPKNVNPFYNTNYLENPIHKKVFILTEADLQGVVLPVKKIVNDFVGCGDNNRNDVPAFGLNSFDITFYLNHSNKNNLDIIYNKKCAYNQVITNRLIRKGEELVINYNLFK